MMVGHQIMYQPIGYHAGRAILIITNIYGPALVELGTFNDAFLWGTTVESRLDSNLIQAACVLSNHMALGSTLNMSHELFFHYSLPVLSNHLHLMICHGCLFYTGSALF